MNTRILLLMIISALVLATSCKKDDDNNDTVTLSGNWNLKNVSGGFAGVDIDYSPGQVIWNFNLKTNILTVENNIITTGPEDTYAGFETGTYPFEIEETGDYESLIVDGIDMGFIVLSEDILQLDEGIVADGFMKTFER